MSKEETFFQHKMPANINKQLQFSNLSYKTTERILLNYFSNYGQIEKINFI